MIYAWPGAAGAKVEFKHRYENYIGGQWVAPVGGEYFENLSPVNGKVYCEIPRSRAADIELALDAAHAAKAAWGRTSPIERSTLLLKIADRIEANLEANPATHFANTKANARAERSNLSPTRETHREPHRGVHEWGKCVRAGAVHCSSRYCEADVPDPGGLHRHDQVHGHRDSVWSRRSAGDLRANASSDGTDGAPDADSHDWS
jgi:hypothetical protein